MKNHDAHFAVQARLGLNPLADRDLCADLWSCLKKRFPRITACVFMPDHLHFLLSTTDPDRARYELATELRAFTRRHFPGQRVWNPLSPPHLIPNDLHLQRTIRYIHLNPCREGLVTDPLEWEWSTHRDLVGAAYPRWIDLQRWMELFKTSANSLIEKAHRYISGDPSVSLKGTPLPKPLSADAPVFSHLRALTNAVLQATRTPIADLKRKTPARHLAAVLCAQFAPHCREELARQLDISVRSLARIERRPLAQPLIDAATQILGDARFQNRGQSQKG
jgi:REP element-mobilizing transposase RayT